MMNWQANARLCKTEHDKCRGTEDFPLSGQNLAWIIYPIPNFNKTEQLITRPLLWFNEYNKTTQEQIDSFPTEAL